MIVTPETITMTTKELDNLFDRFEKKYDLEITNKVNDSVNKVIRDKNVYIYCGLCGKNIFFENEPTVFGSKTKDKSSVYHMNCWNSLENGS